LQRREVTKAEDEFERKLQKRTSHRNSSTQQSLSLFRFQMVNF